jgi:hypothetical protein
MDKEEKFRILDKIVNENPKLKKEIEKLQKEAKKSLKKFMALKGDTNEK